MAKGKSLEETPTWAYSIVCLFFFLISYMIEFGLEHLAEFLRKKRRKSLIKALFKIRAEMMTFGFISFLLTILEVPLTKICVSQVLATSFLPCEDPVKLITSSVSSSDEIGFCEARGMVSLISREGVVQLSIFISVLAVFHILYCILTMCLGMAKMRKWKSWEQETRTLDYRISNDPRRFQLPGQTSIGRRHLKFWSDFPPLLWPVCFFRQFCGSVSKADYFTLRNGFLTANVAEGSNFNFQKFLARAYDDDFVKVVGIRFWIWIFSILFIFFSAHDFYNHYWLPFIPFVIALLVGTKLEVTITKMCVESCKETPVIKGSLLVKPSDNYFWFGKPDWLLHFLQFILIQNSFQLAFFTWSWFEYGPKSCFNTEIKEIAVRIAMGIAAQILCAYVTLPLYALVTQMGSTMKRAVFTERVVRGLKHWHKHAKRSLPKKKSILSRESTNSFHSDISDEAMVSDTQNKTFKEKKKLPPSEATSPVSEPEIVEAKNQIDHACNKAVASHSTPEIITISYHQSEEQQQQQKPKIINIGEANPRAIFLKKTDDDEISFASSWKNRNFDIKSAI